MRRPTLRSSWKVTMGLVAGLVGGAVLVGPAVGHIGSVAHTWNKHFRPLADKRYVRKTEPRTGHVSCPALTWQEQHPGMSYGTSGQIRVLTTGTGTFRCNPSLPHGATITAVRFSIFDASTTELVSCHFVRTDLRTGEVVTIGSAGTTDPRSPGLVRLAASTISNPKINTASFAYQLECFIGGSGTDVGFLGASVSYRITGAQGAVN